MGHAHAFCCWLYIASIHWQCQFGIIFEANIKWNVNIDIFGMVRARVVLNVCQKGKKMKLNRYESKLNYVISRCRPCRPTVPTARRRQSELTICFFQALWLFAWNTFDFIWAFLINLEIENTKGEGVLTWFDISLPPFGIYRKKSTSQCVKTFEQMTT